MWNRLFGPDAKRQRLLKQCPDGPLWDYLAQPYPEGRRRLNEVPLLALDLETTGLDPARDEIVSMGLVEMRHEAIRLNSTWAMTARIPSDRVLRIWACSLEGNTSIIRSTVFMALDVCKVPKTR